MSMSKCKVPTLGKGFLMRVLYNMLCTSRQQSQESLRLQVFEIVQCQSITPINRNVQI